MPINVSQKPIYESYSMLHPDGTLMCHTNSKRANWYVKRELAEWIDDKTFKLKFAPQGKGKSDSPYYTQSLENKCVVCGDNNEYALNKHHVVPYVFRSRFPEQYKQSNHHDILPTCVECHENYEGYATEYKKQLAEKVGASMNGSMSAEQKYNKKILSARNVINRLQNKELKDESGKEVKIPEEKLRLLHDLASKEPLHDEPVSGTIWADKIIENVIKNDDLFEFVRSWRKHFLEFAKPQFLPNHWSVDHPLEKVAKTKINKP